MTSSQSIFATWHASPSDQIQTESNDGNLNNKNSLLVTQGRMSLSNQYLPCTLCYFQNSGILTKCQHKVVCLTCAQNYVKNQIREGKLPKCLIQSCKISTIDEQGLYKKFSSETQKKFKAMQLRLLLKKQSRTWINCQVANCEGYVDQYTQNCMMCNSNHCPMCHRPSHKGQCLGGTYFGQDLKIKTCKMCNGRVYKQGGCGKLTCPSCRKQICYECGEVWSFKHHGCQQGGWLKLPCHIFMQCCSSSSNAEQKETEILM